MSAPHGVPPTGHALVAVELGLSREGDTGGGPLLPGALEVELGGGRARWKLRMLPLPPIVPPHPARGRGARAGAPLDVASGANASATTGPPPPNLRPPFAQLGPLAPDCQAQHSLIVAVRGTAASLKAAGWRGRGLVGGRLGWHVL